MSGRTVRAGQVRLGMTLANGSVVTEIIRPHRDVVKRGYGRVWIAGADLDAWPFYPSDTVQLHPDDDQPLDHTMDDWPGRWWPIDDEVSA